MTLPTRKVKHPDNPRGFMIINADDFAPGQHEPWEDSPAPALQRVLGVSVRKLAEHLQEIDDLELLRAAQEEDERTSAADLYAARIAELEGEED
jgi:hypothetical protein